MEKILFKFVAILASLISMYFISACSDKIDNSTLVYPDAQSQSALLYKEKCSGCHAAPLPSMHTAELWPGILERMQFRMVSKKVEPLAKQELASILEYLQHYAKPSP